MKTPISTPKPPLHVSNSRRWRPKIPSLTLRPTASRGLNHSKKPTHRPNANAKGFGTAPVLAPTIEKNTNKLDSNNEDDDGDEIPQVVYERMIVRIAVSVRVPFAGGLAVLKLFEVANEQQLLDMPVWLPLLTAFFMFAVSAFGLAHGAFVRK